MDHCLHFSSDFRTERSALLETRTALCQLFAAQDQILICRALLLTDFDDLLVRQTVHLLKHCPPLGALRSLHVAKM